MAQNESDQSRKNDSVEQKLEIYQSVTVDSAVVLGHPVSFCFVFTFRLRLLIASLFATAFS